METIYISGPITGKPDYQDRFEDIERFLLDRGLRVINPAKVLASLSDSFKPQELLEICLDLMKHADSVYMLLGWSNSNGASMEYGYAVGRGMKIYGASS